jgi:hypothetical protein
VLVKSEDNDEPMILIVEDYSEQVLDQGQTSAEFGSVPIGHLLEYPSATSDSKFHLVTFRDEKAKVEGH